MHVESFADAIRQPGAAVFAALALASVLTDTAVVAMLWGGDFVELGYSSVGDLGVAGWRLWELPRLLLWLGLVAWCLTLALLGLRVLTRRRIALARASRWALALGLAAVLLAPPWVDAVAVHYSGPGQSLRLALGTRLFPLLSYTGESAVEAPLPASPEESPDFLCTNSRRFKFFSLQVSTSFYPTLDETHGLRLMQERCEPLPMQGKPD